MSKYIFLVLLIFILPNFKKDHTKIVVPFKLDHNRMLIKAKIYSGNNDWKNITLWVDTGNPYFFISKDLATRLGICNISDSTNKANGLLKVKADPNIRIKTFNLDYKNIDSFVVFDQFWLFKATKADANLPATVLKKYDIVFDYQKKEMIMSIPGKIKFSGKRLPSKINQETGIVQTYGQLNKDTISFAIDNGASYSFGSTELLSDLKSKHPNIQSCLGAAGYANMWGRGFSEESCTMARIPEITFGNLSFRNIGFNFPDDFNEQGFGIMDWYSNKTIDPVEGFIGPNVLDGNIIGIDYKNGLLYFDKKQSIDNYDMDLIGITIRLENDGYYKVIKIVKIDGIPVVKGILPGDILLKIDDMNVRNNTMGKVIDALRGHPGEAKKIMVNRKEKRIELVTYVRRLI